MKPDGRVEPTVHHVTERDTYTNAHADTASERSSIIEHSVDGTRFMIELELEYEPMISPLRVKNTCRAW